MNKKTINLTLATGESHDHIDILQELVDAYMKENPSVNVQLLISQWDKYYNDLLNGNYDCPPDVVKVGDEMNDSLSKLLLPLDNILKKDHVSKFDSKLLALGKSGSKLVSIPTDYSPIALYVNKRLLREKNIQIPKGQLSWESLFLILDNFDEKKGIEIDSSLTAGITGVFEIIFRSLGYSIEDLRNEGSSQEAIKFLQKLKKYTSFDVSKNGGGKSFFAEGKIPFLISGTWPYYDLINKSNIDLEILNLPGKRTDTIVSAGYGIHKDTKNKEEAVKLLEYISGPKGQQIISKNTFSTLKTRVKDDRPYIFEELIQTKKSRDYTKLGDKWYKLSGDIVKYITVLLKKDTDKKEKWTSKNTYQQLVHHFM